MSFAFSVNVIPNQSLNVKNIKSDIQPSDQNVVSISASDDVLSEIDVIAHSKITLEL